MKDLILALLGFILGFTSAYCTDRMCSNCHQDMQLPTHHVRCRH